MHLPYGAGSALAQTQRGKHEFVIATHCLRIIAYIAAYIQGRPWFCARPTVPGKDTM
jgi:hypothetical protein